MTIPKFQRTILEWYKKNRRDLPWRRTRDPYAILVSEVMLQQTQVSRVLPKYEQWLSRFPTIDALAHAPQKDIYQVWAGLGYWRRARFLQEAARAICTEHGGRFPRERAALERLPGIGPYTAGALACFAFDNPEPFIDTNIRRVYLHFFFARRDNVSDDEILEVARKAVDTHDPREWHYALFDYGALELKNSSLNRKSRHYTKQSKFEGSFRQFRTLTVRRLLETPHSKAHRRELLDFLEDKLREHERDYSPQDVIDALVKDKLITRKGEYYSIG